MNRSPGDPSGPSACPACEGTGHTLVGTKGSLVLWRCQACTLVFTHPQPTMQVERKYLEEYDLAAHFDAVAARKRVLFERRLGLLREHGHHGGGRLCDVGCAGGQFLNLARAEGWDTFGIEMNPPAAARARETGATVAGGRLEDLEQLPWRSFDVVTCWDTLEHTPTPAVFASKLSQLMAPTGLLVITTLNWNALVRLLTRMRWSMIVEDHFTYWTGLALRRLFEPQHVSLFALESFGLGRDLVKPIDRIAAALPRTKSSPNPRAAAVPSWDTRPSVLRVESVTNSLFRTVGGGVNLLASFGRS